MVVGMEAEHDIAAAVEVDVDGQRLLRRCADGPIDADWNRPVRPRDLAIFDLADLGPGLRKSKDERIEVLANIVDRPLPQ